MYITDPLSNFLPGRIFCVWSPPEKKRGMGVGGVLSRLWGVKNLRKKLAAQRSPINLFAVDC